MNVMQFTLRCPTCGTVKPIEAFPRNRARRSGRAVYCRDCLKAMRDARRERAVCPDCGRAPLKGYVLCGRCIGRARVRAGGAQPWRRGGIGFSNQWIQDGGPPLSDTSSSRRASFSSSVPRPGGSAGGSGAEKSPAPAA
jgi:hypothetical protein